MTTVETQRRSQAERRDEAEHRLLEAAATLVARHGLERVTLAEIGEAAGYSRGLPAHYFGSKSGLIVRLAEHLVDHFLEELSLVEQHPLGLARILGIVRFYLDSAARMPVRTRALYVLLGEGLSSKLVGPPLAELTARSVKEIESNLVAGIRARNIRGGIDTRAQAMAILALLRGSVSQWLLSPRTVDIASLRDEAVAILTRSLKP